VNPQTSHDAPGEAKVLAGGGGAADATECRSEELESLALVPGQPGLAPNIDELPGVAEERAHRRIDWDTGCGTTRIR